MRSGVGCGVGRTLKGVGTVKHARKALSFHARCTNVYTSFIMNEEHVHEMGWEGERRARQNQRDGTPFLAASDSKCRSRTTSVSMRMREKGGGGGGDVLSYSVAPCSRRRRATDS